MTNLPTNLIPTLLRIINDNRRGTIMHDSPDVRAVRDMLVHAGRIESTDTAGYIECGSLPCFSGCIKCGRYAILNKDNECNDCRGPDDNDDCLGCVLKGSDCSSGCELADTIGDVEDADLAADDDYEVCIGCGSFAACDEEALCEDCGG